MYLVVLRTKYKSMDVKGPVFFFIGDGWEIFCKYVHQYSSLNRLFCASKPQKLTNEKSIKTKNQCPMDQRPFGELAHTTSVPINTKHRTS